MLYGKYDVEYLRLSKEDGDVTEGTEEESCSIHSQRTCIHRFLKEKGFPLDSLEEIVDDGYSGTNMNRPGMQKLLRMVERGQVRTVIVRDLSRFARNYLEAGHYLEYVLPAYDVRFISINDHFDSLDYGETTGGLELAIKNLINQMYSRDISRKIKSAVDLKKLSGEYVYGTAPYGYKKGEVRNTIVVDEPAAITVRRIFKWASEGITITQIAMQLNEEKIMTPSVYLAEVRGKYKARATWTYESVRNILSNRIYTGDTVPFKSHVVRVGSGLVRQIPEELQTVIPNTHEALISRELFFQARNVVKSNRKSTPAAPPNPFTSLLVCGCCGNKLSKGKPQNKTWMCATHRYDPSLGCRDVRFDETRLQEIILNAITMQCQVLDAKVKRIRKASLSLKTSEQTLITECETLRRRVALLQTKKMQQYEEYVMGHITKDQFAFIRQELSEQEEQAKLQLAVAEQKRTEAAARMQEAITRESESEQILQYQDMKELTPELTHKLIRQIVIRPDGSIKITWNFRDEIIREVDIAQSVSNHRAV